MRVSIRVALLMLLIPNLSAAQYKFGSDQAPARSWRKTVDGLGLCLFVTTTSGRELVDGFDRPPSGSKLLVREATKVKRNESFTIFLLFQNCPPDSSGNCNLTATYSLLTPDDKAMDQRDLPVWKMPPPPQDKIELSKGVWENIAFDVEPVGTYRVKAVVNDHVKRTTVTLERTLELVESE